MKNVLRQQQYRNKVYWTVLDGRNEVKCSIIFCGGICSIFCVIFQATRRTLNTFLSHKNTRNRLKAIRWSLLSSYREKIRLLPEKTKLLVSGNEYEVRSVDLERHPSPPLPLPSQLSCLEPLQTARLRRFTVEDRCSLRRHHHYHQSLTAAAATTATTDIIRRVISACIHLRPLVTDWAGSGIFLPKDFSPLDLSKRVPPLPGTPLRGIICILRGMKVAILHILWSLGMFRVHERYRQTTDGRTMTL